MHWNIVISDTIGISAIKKSENNDGYLVRLFNPYFNKDANIPKELQDKMFVELNELTNAEKVDKLTHNQFTTIKIDEK